MNEIFCATFKHLRESRELTQSELAKRLEVSRSALGMYEQGHREPDFETLLRIADFFGVTLDYLFGRSEPAEEPTDFEKLDANDRSAVAAMIKSLLSTNKYKRGITA